jgi:hypothetical protein
VCGDFTAAVSFLEKSLPFSQAGHDHLAVYTVELNVTDPVSTEL